MFLPAGWHEKNLDDLICSKTVGLVKGAKLQDSSFEYAYVKMHNISNINSWNPIDVARVNATEEELEKYCLKQDDFLFNTRNSYELVGKSCLYQSISESPVLFNNNIIRIRFSNEITQKFAAYAFCSEGILNQLEEIKQGTTGVSGIYYKTLKDIKVKYPPIPEQKRIVAILDEAFAAIDRARELTERNLQNARELFDSYLNQIFTQKGEGWRCMTLGELGKVSMCKRVLKKQTTSTGDIPFYKIGTFGKEPDAYIPNDLYEEFRSKYSFPKVGDVLISASGTIGRRVVYDGLPAYFQDSNIVWIDNDESVVSNDYLYQFYGSCDWNPSKGATISRLYNDDLRRIKIAFPVKNMQAEIVKEVMELSEQSADLRNKYGLKLKYLDELKKSILQKAFSGELTQQDADSLAS